MTTLSGAITGTTYTAGGLIKSTSYANGVATTYGYSSTRGWLSSISAVNGATTIESLTYGRDAAGRITSVAGGRADESWTYGYDAFDQLLSAANTNTPSLSRTYSYDVGGNLTSNSAVGTYSYPTQGATAYQPHAVMSAGTWTFGYDLNGNQTTRHTGATLDREITYDADNRPVSVTVGGNTVAYLYGPDGARIKKLFGADATLYLGDGIERDPTGTFTNYVTEDVKRVGGASHFLQVDHQASVRAVTDNAGALYRASAFEPFGKQVETVLNPLTLAESKGYIGQRTDPESGLTYLHARYYDTSLGRFLQPDWWDVRDAGVGTNRYAYALNNPIGLSDPGGHCSLVSSCDDDSTTSYASQLQPDGSFKKVPTSQLVAEREQRAEIAQAALKTFKSAIGYRGGMTASTLNYFLSGGTDASYRGTNGTAVMSQLDVGPVSAIAIGPIVVSPVDVARAVADLEEIYSNQSDYWIIGQWGEGFARDNIVSMGYFILAEQLYVRSRSGSLRIMDFVIVDMSGHRQAVEVKVNSATRSPRQLALDAEIAAIGAKVVSRTSAPFPYGSFLSLETVEMRVTEGIR